MNKILPDSLSEADFEVTATLCETDYSTVSDVRFKDPKYQDIAAVYKTPASECGKSFRKEANFLLSLREQADNEYHPHLVLDFVYLFKEQGLLFPKATCDIIDVVERRIWGSFFPKKFHLFRDPVEVCRQMFSAINFLRQNGVIHFDIKPGNFLFFPDGNIKLIDFGLSEFGERLKPRSPNWCRYTVGYTPPEYQAMKAFMLQEAKKVRAGLTCEKPMMYSGRTDDENLMLSIFQSQGHTFPTNGASDVWATVKTLLLLINPTAGKYPDCEHCALKESWDASFPKSELDDPESFTRRLVYSLSLEPVLEEWRKETKTSSQIFTEYVKCYYTGSDGDHIIKDLEALSPILMECLHFDPFKRPSSKSVLDRVCSIQNEKQSGK